MKKKKTLAFCLLACTVAVAVFAMSQKVYCVPNGKKYHCSPQCRMLAHSKTVNEITLEQAEAEKLTPCKVCCH
ncbi:MAG: hypothetical protein II187_11655 [Treponema sp.]|nr:hypothetical protein [Treponema sp.]